MNEIKNLIATGNLAEALELLRLSLPAAHQNEALLLLGRLAKLDRENRLGILSTADANIERSKISYATLELCRFIGGKNDAVPEQPVAAAGGPKVYFSYAWADANEPAESREKVVDDLFGALSGAGFDVRRDKEMVDFGGFISEFMKEIGQGDLIVVFISDKYARSPNCMFELYEIARNAKLDKNQFGQRVLPVAVERIRFDDPDALDPYFDHWKKEEEKWANFIQKRIGNISEAQSKRYHTTKTIHENLGNLLDWLADMNAKTIGLLSENDFDTVKKAILARLEKHGK